MAATLTTPPVTPTTPRGRRVPWIGLYLFPLIPIALLSTAPFGVIDDAYISFRYARNLAVGQGLVFNAHEHVEGVTNLLWTVMLAGLWKLGLPLPTAAPLLGLAFGLLAVREAWKCCDALKVTRWAGIAACLTLLLSAVFWLTITNGLEGGLSAYLAARLLRAVISSERGAVVGLLGGLLFLTRFDTVFLLPVYSLYLLVRERADSGSTVHPGRWLPAATVWASFIGAVTMFRLAYFGALVPNSVLAKRVPLHLAVIADNVKVGTAYCLLFLLLTFPICLGLLRRPRLRPLLLVQVSVGLEMAVVLWNGGDWMPHYRLLTVYEPLCVPFTAQLLALVPGAFNGSTIRRGVMVVALLFGAALYAAMFASGIGFEAPHLTALGPEPCMNSIAHALLPAIRPGDRVASEAIGTLSYTLANTYSSDLDGLTDRTIAANGTLYARQIGRMDPEYSFWTVRPTIIVARFQFQMIGQLARVSKGTYNAVYSSYGITRGDGCAGLNPVVSIRKAQIARFMPALSRLGLQHEVIPTQ